MSERFKTIAVTIGDPNGIGPEIAVKAAAELLGSRQVRVVLVGDEHVLRRYAEGSAGGAELKYFADRSPSNDAILLHPVEALPPAHFRPGEIEAAAGRATVRYVEAALALVRDGHADAIVGCPHNETSVKAAGIPFSGYPGLIARLTGTPEDKVFMMLVGGGLRILHATLHERIHRALARLKPELIEAAGRACAATLKQLGVAKPRIGIFGINPHAGEHGLFGDDDDHITTPAVERLRMAGILVEGPVGAGVLFSSVGHGSAFDIAGHNKGDPAAVLRTLRLVGNIPADAPAPTPATAP